MVREGGPAVLGRERRRTAAREGVLVGRALVRARRHPHVRAAPLASGGIVRDAKHRQTARRVSRGSAVAHYARGVLALHVGAADRAGPGPSVVEPCGPSALPTCLLHAIVRAPPSAPVYERRSGARRRATEQACAERSPGQRSDARSDLHGRRLSPMALLSKVSPSFRLLSSWAGRTVRHPPLAARIRIAAALVGVCACSSSSGCGNQPRYETMCGLATSNCIISMGTAGKSPPR